MEEKEDTKQDKAIAVMANDISYIKKAIEKIDYRLELMDNHFVKREEVNQIKLDNDKAHCDHETRLKNMELSYMELKTRVVTWGTIAIIILGAAEFIIGKFL